MLALDLNVLERLFTCLDLYLYANEKFADSQRLLLKLRLSEPNTYEYSRKLVRRIRYLMSSLLNWVGHGLPMYTRWKWYKLLVGAAPILDLSCAVISLCRSKNVRPRLPPDNVY